MATPLRSEAYRLAGTKCPSIVTRVCAAGATFKAHDFVKLVNGEVADGPAAGNDWGAGNPTVFGQAMVKASPGKPVQVMIPDDNTVFILHYAGTLAQNLVGTTRDLRVDAGGFPVVSTSTSNAKVVIVELIDAPGEVNGRVGVMFLPSARAISN